MAIREAQYVRQPYVGNGLIRLSELGVASARSRANSERERGERSAQAWNMAGNAISSGIGAVRQEQELVPLRLAAQAKLQREAEMIRRQDEQYAEGRASQTADAAKAARLKEVAAEYKGQRIPTERLIQEFGPVDASHIDKAFDELFPKPKEAEPFTLNPGAQRFDGNGNPIASVPEPPKEPKKHTITVPGPNNQPMTILVSEDDPRFEKGIQTYRAPVQGPAPERPSVWVSKGSDQRYVTPSEASRLTGEGWGPSQTRENPTEDERKAAGWVEQAQFAYDNMESALRKDPSADEVGFIEKYSPSEEIANLSRSSARQEYAQAASSFSEAALRAATGAGVNRQEAEQKIRELTPQRGDGADLRAQKRESLKVYLSSLRTRAGRALPNNAPGQPGSIESEVKINAVPDLNGLKKGVGRKFTSGPFSGQTWSLDEQGKPYKVGG